MKLKEKWGGRVWENASTKGIIDMKLSDANGGQVEELQDQIRMLKSMLANFMDESNLTDKQKLEIVGLDYWELVE